jgi:hypothetical protein
MSTLNVDALVGNTSANAITVRGEGSATTSLQQGLAKGWTFTADNAVADSFNTSALTDNGTGDYSFTITNNMANGTFSVTSNVAENIVLILFNIARTTSAYRIGLAYIDGNKYDKNSSTVIHGDLA